MLGQVIAGMLFVYTFTISYERLYYVILVQVKLARMVFLTYIYYFLGYDLLCYVVLGYMLARMMCLLTFTVSQVRLC